MKEELERALLLWGLEGADAELIAQRENTVYRITAPTGRYALRFHRDGYRTDGQLAAELAWMAWLDRAGLSVPAPKPSLAGSRMERVSDRQVDVLTWLDGQTLPAALPSLAPTDRRALFFDLGQSMAQLHEASDRWSGAVDCDRPHWDLEGLLGESPLWGRFWENPALTSEGRALFRVFRTEAYAQLTGLSPALDFGLIHADLVPENVLRAGGTLHFIDFDDGGFGFRAFEVATAVLKHRGHPAYPELEAALLDGYRALRPMPADHLLLFLALRAATYVGWNIARAQEDPTGARNARFVVQASELAAAYLDQK